MLNADLKFVHQPLVVGHYRSLALTGTEERRRPARRQGDEPLARRRRSIPTPSARTRSSATSGRTRPTCWRWRGRSPCIVAGLGEEGKLRAVDLIYTIRQAVIAYAQRLAESEAGAPAEFELAATLIGSGGTGINAGSSARMVAQGTWEANQKLHDSGWPQVGRLVLVEFYLDRASDAWRALQLQSTAAPNQLKVVGFVESGAGALRRSLDSSYRGASYDFISAITGAPVKGAPTITYTLDTSARAPRCARSRRRRAWSRSSSPRRSNDANRDPQIGRTLFDLLVPVEMEPFLGGTSDMVIELDGGTAALPWEVLDTSSSELTGSDPRPWAIRSKLLRKLRTADFRAQVSDANADGSILVIGEPMLDAAMYPALPGARAEAIAVATRFTSGPAGVDAARVRALTGGDDDARNIINALFERPYRIVHVAGHGAPGADGGVVLSGGTYLGAAEVKAMRTVPELVFLNCCHLAARDAKTVLANYDRAEFAAGIAEALIEIGVRCVIAAGWAVEDKPAELFATTFYDTLLGGARFIDAVAAARSAAWKGGDGGNTWSAYQCYGDPGWTWQRDVGDAQRAPTLSSDEFAGVSSPPALTLALETISIRLRFGGDDPAKKKSIEQAAARQDPLPRGQVRAALGQDGRGRRSVRPRLRRCARRRQGDRLVPRRSPRRRRQRLVQGRRGARQPARPARRIAQGPGGGAARHRRGDRAPAEAGRDPADDRARGTARLGLQAAGDGRRPRRRRHRRRAGRHRRQARPAPGRGRCPHRRTARGAARNGAALRQRRAAGPRGQRREPVLSGQERHQCRAAPGVPRTPSGRARGRAACARSRNRWRARRASGPTSGRWSARSSCASSPRSRRSDSPASRRR